jgi:hypothetical protein
MGITNDSIKSNYKTLFLKLKSINRKGHKVLAKVAKNSLYRIFFVFFAFLPEELCVLCG